MKVLYLHCDISVLCDLSSSLFKLQEKLYSQLEQNMIAYTKKKKKIIVAKIIINSTS